MSIVSCVLCCTVLNECSPPPEEGISFGLVWSYRAPSLPADTMMARPVVAARAASKATSSASLPSCAEISPPKLQLTTAALAAAWAKTYWTPRMLSDWRKVVLTAIRSAPGATPM